MDWGLLDVNSSNFLLRDDLVFYKWVSKHTKEKELLVLNTDELAFTTRLTILPCH